MLTKILVTAGEGVLEPVNSLVMLSWSFAEGSGRLDGWAKDIDSTWIKGKVRNLSGGIWESDCFDFFFGGCFGEEPMASFEAIEGSTFFGSRNFLSGFWAYSRVFTAEVFKLRKLLPLFLGSFAALPKGLTVLFGESLETLVVSLAKDEGSAEVVHWRVPMTF